MAKFPEVGPPTDTQTLYESLQEPHPDMPSLLAKLQMVEDALPKAGLACVVPFAKAYRSLTDSAYTAALQGHFVDVPTTERVACEFADWYFDPLHAQISDAPTDIPLPWQQVFDPTEANRPPWLSLALAMNAHIGHDLPYALQQAKASREYKDDFFSVNSIIKETGPSIAPQYLPALPAGVRHGIAVVTQRVIIGWRQEAWDTFEALAYHGRAVPKLGQRIEKRGQRLRRVNQALGVVGISGA